MYLSDLTTSRLEGIVILTAIFIATKHFHPHSLRSLRGFDPLKQTPASYPWRRWSPWSFSDWRCWWTSSQSNMLYFSEGFLATRAECGILHEKMWKPKSKLWRTARHINLLFIADKSWMHWYGCVYLGKLAKCRDMWVCKCFANSQRKPPLHSSDVCFRELSVAGHQ